LFRSRGGGRSAATIRDCNDGGTTIVQDLAYGYDASNNITSITNNRVSARSQTFQYDALYRLTQGNDAYGTFDYSYDVVGNRLTRILSNSSSNFSESYSYSGTSNQLQTVINASMVRTLSYDSTAMSPAAIREVRQRAR
jgi:YD repeat-containing protein